MILSNYTSGQLGNRLFYNAALQAMAKDAGGLSIIDINIKGYEKHFENYAGNALNVMPSNGFLNWLLNSKLLRGRVISMLDHIRDYALHNKVNNQFVRYVSLEELSQRDEFDYNEVLGILKSSLIVVTDGWIYKDFCNLARYQREITAHFKPNTANLENAKAFVKQQRADVDMVVGLHIRRGDYKTFLDGKYYLEDVDYVNLLKQFASFFEGKKIRYVICSNEQIELSNYAGFDVVMGPNHIIEDMYTLSECDYIMGVVSTYSMWASFAGRKPLCIIHGKEQVITLTDFKVVEQRV